MLIDDFLNKNVGGPVLSSSLQLAQWNIYLRMCSLNPSLLQKVPVHPTFFTCNNLTSIGNKPPNKNTYPPGN